MRALSETKFYFTKTKFLHDKERSLWLFFIFLLAIFIIHFTFIIFGLFHKQEQNIFKQDNWQKIFP